MVSKNMTGKHYFATTPVLSNQRFILNGINHTDVFSIIEISV